MAEALTSGVGDIRSLLAKELEKLAATQPQCSQQLMFGLDDDVSQFIRQSQTAGHS